MLFINELKLQLLANYYALSEEGNILGVLQFYIPITAHLFLTSIILDYLTFSSHNSLRVSFWKHSHVAIETGLLHCGQIRQAIKPAG